MTCASTTLVQMKTELTNCKLVRRDKIIPLDMLPPGQERFVQHVDPATGAWLTPYERTLWHAVEAHDFPFPVSFESYFFESPEQDCTGKSKFSQTVNGNRFRGSPVHAALENAMNYGYDPGGKTVDLGLPIAVDVYTGHKGLICTVTDCGKGFDFDRVARISASLMEGKAPPKYYNNMGWAFVVYHQPHLDGLESLEYDVSGEGSRINICFRWQERPVAHSNSVEDIGASRAESSR